VWRDDLGSPVELNGPARRVVSLVPSLTEAVARSAPGLLVGATDWCTHPADLAVTRVRGTKNPERAAIIALAPDLVIANREENRKLDVDRLRDAGLAVWVTVVESVPDAMASMRRMLTGPLGLEAPAWLAAAEQAWAEPAPAPSRRVAVPIWRDPWMVVGARTFTGDVLARLGPLPARRGRADPGGSARPGAAARRALPVHPGRRAGGIPGPPRRPRPGPPAHLVRPQPRHRPHRTPPCYRLRVIG